MDRLNKHLLRTRLKWPLIFGLLWLVSLSALAAWSAKSERGHSLDSAERKAKILFEQMVLMRSWNSRHVGVFVKSSKDSPPNPHLKPEDRVLTAADGTRYSRINPAYMTRQLGILSEKAGNVVFHIAGLEPMSLSNKPDIWEKESLISFERGGQARFQLVDTPQGKQFKYMAPLKVEEKCLVCHTSAGNRKTLGGISVSFPAEESIASCRESVARTHIAFTLIGLVGLTGIVGSSYQILKKRDEAQRANLAKSMFIANMSHDMRTPLTGIMGMAELVERGGLDKERKQYMLRVRQSAQTLLEIVDDITEFSRLESGQMTLACSPFDLRAVLGDVLDVYGFAASSKNLDLRLSVADDVPQYLVGDSFRIKQIISNLVGNAVKFTEKGSVGIHVARCCPPSWAKQEEVCLEIKVADTGIGIPEAEFGRIFYSFNQIDNSYAKRHVGTGLGLSICKRLAEMMHGGIRVESVPGSGSTFTLSLRLAEAGESPARKEGQSAAPGAERDAKTILLVEDNDLNQCFFINVLQDAGHTVVSAANSVEAGRQLREGAFDLVLMDIQIPGVDGLEISRRIRGGGLGADPDIPILGITASVGPDVEENCRQAGMNGYLPKPLSGEALLESVEAYTANVAPQRGTGQEADAALGEAALIDRDAALRNLGGKTELYDRLLAAFVDDVPAKIAALRRAVREGNRDEVIRLSHAVKNSAALVQANQLACLAREMEERADGEGLEAVGGLFAGIESKCGETVALIRAERGERRG